MADERRPQPPGQQDPAGPWVEKNRDKQPQQPPQDQTRDRDRSEGRDRAPSNPDRDEDGPWLGGG